MSLSKLRGRAQDAVYGTLADDATWNGVPVTVRTADPDAVVTFRETEVVMPSMIIKVPRSQVEAPATGDTVVMTETGDTYTILADPVLNKRHEWVCQAEKG